ncbi:MAG: hypothetical protein HND57_01800 [Planctomycetes bacterium]|nr:hypothetical protein [Planctomycetota bacterium]
MSERHPSQQEQKDSQTAAEQRFMHGLLSYLHRQDDEAREARIQRVMHAVTQESDSTQTPSVLRFTTTLYQHWKSVSSLAAAAIIVFALFLFSTILPTGPSAYAVVQTSLSAASTAGAHRYNIYAALPHEENIGETAIATLDIADADHHVFILTRPRGGQLVTGCNEDGTWAIRRDGAIERYRPGMARPRWAAIGQMTIFASSIDDLIDEFGDLYDFTFGADDAIEGQPTVSYTRVTATYRDPETSPDSPARFEFWIAPDTQMIQRLEIYWDLPTPQEQQTLGRGEREGRMPRPTRPAGRRCERGPAQSQTAA